MKKTITQKMTEELQITKPLRTYFDAGSSEFNRTDFDEKIQTISKIISNGYDLKSIIKQYKLNYSSDGYKHVYDNAIPTLKGFISYLNYGVSYDLRTLKELEKASDTEVIELLTEIVKEKIIKG